jgi:hypothetical protein
LLYGIRVEVGSLKTRRREKKTHFGYGELSFAVVSKKNNGSLQL